MRYFTDSPYERMMMQQPSARPLAADAGVNAGCAGCGYGEKKPCIAVCMKKLTAPGRKSKARTGVAG